MQRLSWKKHPFRRLFYLELILLGIAFLAVFSRLQIPREYLPPPHVLRHHRFHQPPIIFTPGILVSLGILALMGLRLPFGSRLMQGVYTSVGLGLSWLIILWGGRGERVFPALLLVVAIRACLMFPWSGRIVVGIFTYISFILMQMMSVMQIQPFGVSLGKRLPRVLRRISPDSAQQFLIYWKLNAAVMFGLVLIFVMLLVGTLLAQKQSREKLAVANQRLREYALLIENQATLQERNRIAREIHDSVGHSLTAQSIQLENVAMQINVNLEQAKQHLDKARQLGKEALQNVRNSVATLRKNPLQGKSLTDALINLIQDFEKTTGTKVVSEIYLQSSLPDEISTALYRVVQEALTNVSKHGYAERVKLDLREKITHISLLLEDNGQGFDPNENTTGFGLRGMRERVETFGGRFKLSSQPDRGCKIQVEIPLSVQHDPSFTG